MIKQRLHGFLACAKLQRKDSTPAPSRSAQWPPGARPARPCCQLLAQGACPWPWRGGESIASIRGRLGPAKLISSQVEAPLNLRRARLQAVGGWRCWASRSGLGSNGGRQARQHRPQGGEINGLEAAWRVIAARTRHGLPTLLSHCAVERWGWRRTWQGLQRPTGATPT